MDAIEVNDEAFAEVEVDLLLNIVCRRSVIVRGLF
jgi:hypothetical protein